VSTAVAELIDVHKRFADTEALRGLSMTIMQGEIVAVLGPNGAGKTTAMNLLLGLRQPDQGTARLYGQDPRNWRARRNIGVTPQDTDFPVSWVNRSLGPPQVRGFQMPREALLVIDIQKEVLDPKGTLGGDLPKVADDLLAAVRTMVDWAHGQSVPVIWIRMAFREGYIDAPLSVREAADEMAGRLVDGSWGADICDDVGQREDDFVITKKRPSAFFGTDLDWLLRGLGVERLIVIGTSTNWAVESTVRDAESLDYRVVIAREATGARMGDMHEPSLRTMGTRFAEVVSVAEVIGGSASG
tara:strand:- start:190 stop:1089 length:900 start_codon:yes stop_codon:yes gene_type:complete